MDPSPSLSAPDWVTLARRLGAALEFAGQSPLERRGVLKVFGVRMWIGREAIRTYVISVGN